MPMHLTIKDQVRRAHAQRLRVGGRDAWPCVACIRWLGGYTFRTGKRSTCRSPCRPEYTAVRPPR
jgi:hypothetical protein